MNHFALPSLHKAKKLELLSFELPLITRLPFSSNFWITMQNSTAKIPMLVVDRSLLYLPSFPHTSPHCRHQNLYREHVLRVTYASCELTIKLRREFARFIPPSESERCLNYKIPSLRLRFISLCVSRGLDQSLLTVRILSCCVKIL